MNNLSEREFRQWFLTQFDDLIANIGKFTIPNTSIISSLKEEREYLAMHKWRFYEILNVLRKRKLLQSSKILDIGTSHLTILLREMFENVTTIDNQSGWSERVEKYGIRFIKHNLLDSHLPFEKNEFDVVVCGEVLDHISVHPSVILSSLAKNLRRGGLIILTLENAVSYYHRRDMSFGKNPFQMTPLDSDPTGSWHGREYTNKEILDAFQNSGYEIKNSYFPLYWNKPMRSGLFPKIKGLLLGFIFYAFPSLRDAMFFVAVRK